MALVFEQRVQPTGVGRGQASGPQAPAERHHGAEEEGLQRYAFEENTQSCHLCLQVPLCGSRWT